MVSERVRLLQQAVWVYLHVEHGDATSRAPSLLQWVRDNQSGICALTPLIRSHWSVGEAEAFHSWVLGGFATVPAYPPAPFPLAVAVGRLSGVLVSLRICIDSRVGRALVLTHASTATLLALESELNLWAEVVLQPDLVGYMREGMVRLRAKYPNI
ncbi:hypothetical protein GGG16DRAFT_113804 [Schizophyllum commune]|nr:hypothetical protein K525DRAFT_271088 [Schizophyllum commune Loenen D]